MPSEPRLGGEAVLAAQRLAALGRELRNLGERHGTVGALDADHGRVIADIGARRFQHLAGERAPMLDHRVRAHHARRSADPHGPGTVRSEPLLHLRGIAVDESHRVEVDAEPVGGDLRVHGLVSHAEILSPGEHRDRAVGMGFDLRVLGRGAAVVLHVGRRRDAAQPPVLGRSRAPGREPRHVDGLDRVVQVRPADRRRG